jgi:hypothetical protein
VASGAGHWFPGGFSVVALPTKLAFEDDFFHIDIIRAGLHFEDCRVAHFTLEFNAMNPVWEDHWRHSTLFGFAVEHHVAVKPLDRFPSE